VKQEVPLGSAHFGAGSRRIRRFDRHHLDPQQRSRQARRGRPAGRMDSRALLRRGSSARRTPSG
jgi:hypothetical protein